MGSDDLWQLIKNGRSERLDWLSENAPLDTMATILTGDGEQSRRYAGARHHRSDRAR